jgi:hypothetical protein
MSETLGTHPKTGLYHTDHMPQPEDPSLRAVREKQLAGESLSIAESMQAGRDTTYSQFGEHPVKPDHVYRTIDQAGLQAYTEAGAVRGQGEMDEFKEGENNHGVDWYLGGVATRYGDIVLEMPATPDYFEPAHDHGAALAKDPKVRHMKSSGTNNPVPLEHVTIYQKDSAGDYRAH